MLRLLVLLLSLLVVFPAPLAAEPRKSGMSEKQKEQKGRAHFTRGKELAEAGRYVEALVELTKGYELTGRPLFLFNMAEAARAMGDVAQAKELYEKYLAAEATGPFANAARARLVELTPPAPPEPEPPPAPSATVLPTPSATAATAEERRPSAVVVTSPPAKPRESHTLRNVLIVGTALAVVGGAIAIYAGTRDPACNAGCVDLR